LIFIVDGWDDLQVAVMLYFVFNGYFVPWYNNACLSWYDVKK